MWKQWVVTLSALGQLSCGWCIARGARVRTPRGERAIEDLALGDELIVVDPESRLVHTGRITEIRWAKRECARLEFKEGSIELTSAHPLFDPTKREWAPAGDWILGLREKLLRLDPEGALFEDVVSARSRFVGMDDVFDLTVDHPAHTFVANGVVVHNKKPALPPCQLPDGGTAPQGSVCACPGADGVLTCHAGSPATCECPEALPRAYFTSDWQWRTGSSDDAILDGARWTRATCPDHPRVLAVLPSVAGIPINALEITERGEGVCGRVEKVDALPPGVSHWGRISFDIDSNVPNETVVLGTDPPQFTLLGMRGDDAGVRLFLRAHYAATGEPLADATGLWVSNQGLPPRNFFRYDWRFEQLTASTFRVWPRTAGVFSTAAADGGRLFLEEWYDAGNAFGLVDAGNVRTISIGTDGPAGSRDAGGRWYVNGFGLSDEGWLP